MAGKQSPKGRAETGQPVEEMVSVILEPKGATSDREVVSALRDAGASQVEILAPASFFGGLPPACLDNLRRSRDSPEGAEADPLMGNRKGSGIVRIGRRTFGTTQEIGPKTASDFHDATRPRAYRATPGGSRWRCGQRPDRFCRFLTGCRSRAAGCFTGDRPLRFLGQVPHRVGHDVV